MIPTDRLLVLAGAASLFSLTSSYIIQPSCNTTYQPFIYVGCYTDDRDSRSLPLNPGLDFGSLTVEKCTAACKGNSYQYAGVGYYGECWCGADITANTAPETDCSYPCNGDQKENCGGFNKISVYADPTFPAHSASGVDYTYVGCYTDNNDGRTLDYSQDAIFGPQMTTELCLNTCGAKGYAYAGTEWGQQCFCGVIIDHGGSNSPESDCSYTCAGNSAETCGGSSRLSLYSANRLFSTESCGFKHNSTSPLSSSETKSASSFPNPPSTLSTIASQSPFASTTSTSSSFTTLSDTSSTTASSPSFGNSTIATITLSTAPSKTLIVNTTSSVPANATIATPTNSTQASTTARSTLSCTPWTCDSGPISTDHFTSYQTLHPNTTESSGSGPFRTDESTSYKTFNLNTTLPPNPTITPAPETTTIPITAIDENGTDVVTETIITYVTEGDDESYTSPTDLPSCDYTPPPCDLATRTERPPPAPTQSCICATPAPWADDKCVGKIPLPCVGCNDKASERHGHPFKLYTSDDTETCPRYHSFESRAACQDACKSQYVYCLAYADAFAKGGIWIRKKCDQQYKECFNAQDRVENPGYCTKFGEEHVSDRWYRWLGNWLDEWEFRNGN